MASSLELANQLLMQCNTASARLSAIPVQQPRKSDVQCRKPHASELQLFNDKAPTGRRRSSLGARATMATGRVWDPAETAEIIQMARDMRDVHQLLSLIEQLADETGLDVTDLNIPGRKEEYLEYLAAISALKARAEQAQNSAPDEAIQQKKLAATRDLDILVQDKRNVVQELQAEMERVTAEIAALAFEATPDSTHPETENAPTQADVEAIEAEIADEEARAGELQARLAAARAAAGQVSMMDTERLKETLEALRREDDEREAEMKRLMEETPELKLLKTEKEEVETEKMRLSDECAQLDKNVATVRRAFRSVLKAAAGEGQQFAQVLQILMHEQGEMYFDDLRDKIVGTVGLTDAQATTLLYNLVAQRLITIDRTSLPVVRLC